MDEEERRSNRSKVPHPSLMLTMVASSTAWLIIVIGFGAFANNGKGMPYGTWWILWFLVALTAVPVFVALRRLRKQTRGAYGGPASVVTFVLPPALAVGLVALAGQCADLSSIASCFQCNDSCPSHPVVVGWVWLWIGFGVLWAMVVHVLRTDSGDQSTKT
jgi:hypothetical protein